MKFARRERPDQGAAHALRALIRAEMAHEQAGRDESRAAYLEAQVREARENHRRLSGADA